MNNEPKSIKSFQINQIKTRIRNFFSACIAISLINFARKQKKSGPRGRFHQHMRAAFAPDFYSQKICCLLWRIAFGEWRTNLANGAQIWQMAHKSGEFQHTNLVRNAQFELMKLKGKFFAERCAPASFRLAHKVW